MNALIYNYESEQALSQYLLFHYGSDVDQLPFSFGPKDALHFPIRCVTECLDIEALPRDAKGLDLGCAVGRSSFELSKHCRHVLAIDKSHSFISAAQQIQQEIPVDYTIQEEAGRQSKCVATFPADVFPERVEFRCADVMSLENSEEKYDVILAANILCRLPDPRAFLNMLSLLMNPEGQLILISPYSWLEGFTPEQSWLGKGNQKALEDIQEFLEPNFELQRTLDLPFLIREHLRIYQWGISQASLWKRK